MHMKKALFFAITAFVILLLSGCSGEEHGTHIALNDAPNTIETDPSAVDTPTDLSAPTQPESPLASINPSHYGNFSADKLMEISAYARQTDDGIELIKLTNDFASGYLIYTIMSADVVTSLDEMHTPADGFLYETYNRLDEETGRWVHTDVPAHIQEDGSFADGYYLVLIDITVSNHDAARRTDRVGDYDDPYLFRADSFLTLADLWAERGDYEGANYQYTTIDYFSEQDRYPENPCVFRLEPDKTINFTIGFLLNAQDYGSDFDLSRFRACTTSGNEDSAFIDLNLGSK